MILRLAINLLGQLSSLYKIGWVHMVESIMMEVFVRNLVFNINAYTVHHNIYSKTYFFVYRLMNHELPTKIILMIL